MSHDEMFVNSLRNRIRAIFAVQKLNEGWDVLNLFDSPDNNQVTGVRPATTVPTQALLMLNSDLVMQSAEGLAERVLTWDTAEDHSRISRIYQIAFGRDATAEEMTANHNFLKTVDAQLMPAISDADPRRQQSWTALCHVVLATSEFLYLR